MTVNTRIPTAPTPRAPDHTPTERESEPRSYRIRRINRWLSLLLVMSVVAIAVALGVLVVFERTPTTSGAEAAWAARLDAAAAQHEASRQARANNAWTARLDAAAG